MAHIDLYEAFGLDRTASTAQLAYELGARLASSGKANTAFREQVRTAQTILGDPQRRAAYDARLADPSGPPLDVQMLHDLAGLPGAPLTTTTPTTPSWLPPTKVMVAVIATLVVVLVAAVVAIVATGSDDNSQVSATPAASAADDGPSGASPDTGAPPSRPTDSPPVLGAFPGGGGPRPATAEPLPTYVGRYTKLTSAHLLTPTGGIGCDFNQPDPQGKQGQCGVKSMSGANSPLGCVQRVGTCKGRWLFQLSDNRVGQPVDSSGTTGWMNQPGNDGYQVPRVQYGKQYYFEDWIIASESNGLTVWNAKTGSGVFLSNERVEKFDGPGGTTESTGTSGAPIVLGSPQSNGIGYGSAQPGRIHLGGASSTSEAKGLTWKDWGSDRTEATGLGNYQPPDKSGIYRESGVPVTVVAFAPGTCDRKRAYTRIVYYFPSKGQSFDPANGIDICTKR